MFFYRTVTVKSSVQRKPKLLTRKTCHLPTNLLICLFRFRQTLCRCQWILKLILENMSRQFFPHQTKQNQRNVQSQTLFVCSILLYIIKFSSKAMLFKLHPTKSRKRMKIKWQIRLSNIL